ncbi:MAG: DUF362 domain-containing protein [Deltaproteobacteria bacterium]|nr:DUF362 domain-containing protein [Deltaproteobacteria bacterium]
MSTVHLAAACASDRPQVTAAKVRALWHAAGFDRVVAKGDLTAIKLHVGEPGTKTFVSPDVAAALVRCCVDAGAKPFLTDTAVLYRSERDNGVDHARVAAEHGFGLDRVGAPFIPADGLIGADEIEVRVDGKHFETVAIAAAILQARSIIVLSHATGHLGTGYGGALKNLGMGCASRKGKLRQHHGRPPKIDSDRCTGCGSCAEWCPAHAIEVDRVARIDAAKCIGCGQCIAVCRDHAVEHGWGFGGARLQQRIVDHAAAVVRSKQGKIGYLTVAEQITKDCDCMGKSQRPLLPDIGLLAAQDPVAIEQALLDLVRARAGRTLESMSYPRLDGSAQIRYAEEMGLGESQVELVELPA